MQNQKPRPSSKNFFPVHFYFYWEDSPPSLGKWKNFYKIQLRTALTGLGMLFFFLFVLVLLLKSLFPWKDQVARKSLALEWGKELQQIEQSFQKSYKIHKKIHSKYLRDKKQILPLLSFPSVSPLFHLARDSLSFAEVYHYLLRNIPHRMPLQTARIRISSPFGMRLHPFSQKRKLHKGVDLRGGNGIPVAAAASGTVTHTQRGKKGYGNFVKITHSSGYVTLYAHMLEIWVKKDQFMEPGEFLGTVGSSGRATGPHLHYEVRKNQVSLNPINYLPLN